MKIQRIINNIQNKVDFIKYKNKQNFVNKFVPINDTGSNPKALNEIYQVRDRLAKEASSNGVCIEIFDKTNAINGSEAAEVSRDKNLLVRVTNLLNNKNILRVVNGDTEKISQHKTNSYIVIDYPADGIQQTRITTSTYEDTFLRNLYRNIADMTNKVLGKK